MTPDEEHEFFARQLKTAHTLGFNSDSCGIAVIGNFDQVKASDTAVRGVAAVAARVRPGCGRLGEVVEGRCVAHGPWRRVRVRLLLDDMDAAAYDDILTALARHPNVQIRLFNPFPRGLARPVVTALSVCSPTYSIRESCAGNWLD